MNVLIFGEMGNESSLLPENEFLINGNSLNRVIDNYYLEIEKSKINGKKDKNEQSLALAKDILQIIKYQNSLLEEKQTNINIIYNSYSYRIGNRIIRPLSWLKNLLK